jgi:hypothetical protein
MACPQVSAGEDGLEIKRTDANKLNKQTWTDDKGWFFKLGVGWGLQPLSLRNYHHPHHFMD